MNNMEGITDYYERVLGSLSLFRDASEEIQEQNVYLERPVTPINDEIKLAPTVFSTLVDYVRRRVKSGGQEEVSMDPEEQENLAAVILSEVSYIWRDLRLLPEDPFLTAEKNKELLRRITVHIVTTCQILFRRYLQKLEVLNSRGVFTNSANIVRLKAQLANDAHQLLDISTIRRHIVEDIKNGLPEVSDDASEFSLTFKEEVQPNLEIKPHLSFIDLTNASRPKIPSKKKPCTVAEDAVLEMLSEMPIIDTQNLKKPLNTLPVVMSETPFPKLEHEEVEKEKPSGVDSIQALPEENGTEKVRLKRSKSLSELPSAHSECDGCRARCTEDLWQGGFLTKNPHVAQNLEPNITVDSKQCIKDDLKKLLLCESMTTSEDDIPPLIQFLHSNSRTDLKREELEERLRQLEVRESARKKKERLILEQNLHAQPSIVTKKISEKFQVRTADVRISNRISLSTLTLNKHGPIYNHLSNELDVEMSKKLDANLFLKEEMTDVFEEIMKTMPRDYLQPESDTHVEAGPESGTLMGSFSATNLKRKPSHRIINRNLQHLQKLKTAYGFHGDNFNQGSGEIYSGEQMNRDLLSKSVGSWLTWWKNTTNSDDYMKYLSTQETDYLGVLFHFYNSDDEEEDEEKIQIERKRKLENEQKLNDMLSEKTKYVHGLWNANAVLMGGLGQIPTIDVSSDESSALLSKAEKDAYSPKSKSNSFIRQKIPNNSPSFNESKPETDSTALSTKSLISNAQERLENIWASLQMPDAMKLDMAVKYSLDSYYQKLYEAVDDWEVATDLILCREKVILQLEKFERVASDPTRLLGQGSCASKQLTEARSREGYNRKISALDVRLKVILNKIEKFYQDVVTYQGRPYKEKMDADRTEMLFWLQEERKSKILDCESRSKRLPPLPSDLILLHPICVGDRIQPSETVHLEHM